MDELLNRFTSIDCAVELKRMKYVFTAGHDHGHYRPSSALYGRIHRVELDMRTTFFGILIKDIKVLIPSHHPARQKCDYWKSTGHILYYL